MECSIVEHTKRVTICLRMLEKTTESLNMFARIFVTFSVKLRLHSWGEVLVSLNEKCQGLVWLSEREKCAAASVNILLSFLAARTFLIFTVKGEKCFVRLFISKDFPIEPVTQYRVTGWTCSTLLENFGLEKEKMKTFVPQIFPIVNPDFGICLQNWIFFTWSCEFPGNFFSSSSPPIQKKRLKLPFVVLAAYVRVVRAQSQRRCIIFLYIWKL